MPNASRCCAYRIAALNAAVATPTARAATLIRPVSNPAMTCLNPLSLDAPNQRLRPDAAVIEYQLRRVESPVPQLVEVLPNSDAGVRLLDDEAAHAPVSRLGVRVGLCQHSERVAILRVRDEHLRPVDNVLFAILRGRRSSRLYVAPCFRLGQREATPKLPAGEARQVVCTLIAGAEVGDDMSQHVVSANYAADTHPAPAELLEYDRESRVVQPQAAVLLGYRDTEKPHLPHRLDKLLRVDVLVVVPLRYGLDFAPDEVPHERNDLIPNLCRCCGCHATLRVLASRAQSNRSSAELSSIAAHRRASISFDNCNPRPDSKSRVELMMPRKVTMSSSPHRKSSVHSTAE